jgi:uroporphyrinogen decarboxylase
LGQHLNALGVIAMELRGGVPFLMTVFSPMSIAARLAESDEVFLSHLRERPDLVHPALEAVTETFIRFSQAVLRTGASGLFFATTSWGTYDYLTDEEYYQLARPYDLKLLKAVPEAEFHLLHVCKDRNMLRSLSDYPVDAFNWDVHGEGNLSLRGGRDITGKGVVGGIDHRILLQEGVEKQVIEEVKVQVHEMGTTGWMLGTGCTYHPRVPDINLMALREAVSGVG